MFGRSGSVSDQPIDGIIELGRPREKLDTNEIAVIVMRPRIAEMTHARVGDRGLAIEHQTDGLHGLDGQGLMGLDERAMVREIVHSHRIAGVELSPERPEHFKARPGSAIAGRAHQRSHLVTIGHVNCKRIATRPLQASRTKMQSLRGGRPPMSTLR